MEERLILSSVRRGGTRRALLCYTLMPFLKRKATHTNFSEVNVIADHLGSAGFTVDVVHYTYKGRIDYSRYDLIFGFGEPFEESFSTPEPVKRIHYLTGAYSFYQNAAEISRVIAVNEKYNGKLTPKRLVKWTWPQSLMLSDLVVIVGNQWTLSTYPTNTLAPLRLINATAMCTGGSPIKVINSPRVDFLWFGSSGLVHKGLDLCLEFFRKNSGYHIHICGPKEQDFMSLFRSDLLRSNVHFHGFVDVGSDLYRNIVSKCLFAVLPTCSEGQSTSLLTVMADGLIPIATINSGLDIDTLGIVIEELSTESVAKAISKALSLPTSELKTLSQNAHQHINRCHSLNVFGSNIDDIIKSVESD